MHWSAPIWRDFCAMREFRIDSRNFNAVPVSLRVSFLLLFILRRRARRVTQGRESLSNKHFRDGDE